MRLNLFTIIAKDNVDVNAKATKVKGHYHGISMSIMQFITEENTGMLKKNYMTCHSQ